VQLERLVHKDSLDQLVHLVQSAHEVVLEQLERLVSLVREASRVIGELPVRAVVKVALVGLDCWVTPVHPAHQETPALPDLEVYLEPLVTLETWVLTALMAESVPRDQRVFRVVKVCLVQMVTLAWWDRKATSVIQALWETQVQGEQWVFLAQLEDRVLALRGLQERRDKQAVPVILGLLVSAPFIVFTT